jgi:hypothetical protein
MVNERAVVVFDDERAVANAGMMLPAPLAQRLGIQQLVDDRVDLGDLPASSWHSSPRAIGSLTPVAPSAP